MSRYYKGNGLCGPTQYVTTQRRCTPGPKYALAGLTGYEGHEVEATKNRAPAYSLKARLRQGQTDQSPGPAAYLPMQRQTRVGNDGTPSYSLANRHKELHRNPNPGPGAYAPEKHYFPPSVNPPQFSFGHRTKERKHDGLFNPAPNSYILPSRIGTPHPDLKRAPGYFMTSRGKRGGFSEDLAGTPGPAAYGPQRQNAYKYASPEYTMRPKCAPPGDKTVNPGPAAHRRELCPHTAYSTKKGTPAFSFGIRHHDYAVEPIFTDCEIECVQELCC